MTQWLKNKKQTANKKAPIRSTKDIEQEYTNTAAMLGDAHFKTELERAKVQQLTLKLSQLSDEHKQSKQLEDKTAPVEIPTPAEPLQEAQQ